MKSISASLGLLFPAIRISLTLTLLTSCLLFTAEFLGFTPNEDQFLLDARKRISESMAIQFSLLDPVKDIKKIKSLTNYVAELNPEILSAGVRQKSGELIFKSKNHEEFWRNSGDQGFNSTQISVPIQKNSELWGTVEFRFKRFKNDSFLGMFDKSIFKTFMFILLIGFCTYLIFILRILRGLDPSEVIPDRVNVAFDTLSEGIIIVDEKEQILLHNKAFFGIIGLDKMTLIGKKISELPWQQLGKKTSNFEFPWTYVLNNNEDSIGTHLLIKSASGEDVKLVVNASPIQTEGEETQGVLISIDNITELEQHNDKLQAIVQQLKKTQIQVKEQNKELSFLATRDPMTGCLNRRSFTDQFSFLFEAAQKSDAELSFIMVDLDHFKLVNDNYGHATGDEVIKLLANILKSCTRKEDLVARYGGEEFCVVLKGMSAEAAVIVAERIRLEVKAKSAERFKDGPKVAASLGVASMLDKPKDPDDLNNKADEALYVAKESGRDQVVRWLSDFDADKNNKKQLPEIVDTPLEKIPKSTPNKNENVVNLQNRIAELEDIASQFSSELEQSKNYDTLTNLPSKTFFYDQIQQTIENGHSGGQFSALLIIDIEMFSQVNATLGRGVGDQLLKLIAERLVKIIRIPQRVSRLNGDEFSVLLTGLSEKDQVIWAVKRLKDSINQPFIINGNDIYVSCHIGISVYPSDHETPDELLNGAMTAKNYSKKHKSELNYHFFDNKMQVISVRQLSLEKELNQAIKNEEWKLHYQAKLDMKQHKIVGVEALIRWDHPRRGLLPPAEFIDFAEQRGLIVAIGDWVIKQSCLQLKLWMNQGNDSYKIAINLSAVQLAQKDIAHKILSTLEHYGVPPRLFEIEITETALINNIEVATESLQRLSSRGVSIAIDDFGVGYSSLSYLKNLPINKIKIDRSFIKDICNDGNDQKIVKPIILMAHSMGLSVIAEGVETQSQYDLLNKYDCDEMQGHLLSKPINAVDFEKFLLKHLQSIDLKNINKSLNFEQLR